MLMSQNYLLFSKRPKKFLILLATAGLLSISLLAQTFNIQNNWKLLGAIETVDVSKFDNKCVDFVWKYSPSDATNPWKLHIANSKTYAGTSSFGILDSILQGDGFWVKGNGDCSITTEELKQIIKFGDLNLGINKNNEFSISLPKNSDIIDMILFNTLELDTKDLNLADGIVNFKITMSNSVGEKLVLSVPYIKNGSEITLQTGSTVSVENKDILLSTSAMEITDNNSALKFSPKYFLNYVDSNSFYAKLVKGTFEFFFTNNLNGYDVLINLNDIKISGHINIMDN